MTAGLPTEAAEVAQDELARAGLPTDRGGRSAAEPRDGAAGGRRRGRGRTTRARGPRLLSSRSDETGSADGLSSWSCGLAPLRDGPTVGRRNARWRSRGCSTPSRRRRPCTPGCSRPGCRAEPASGARGGGGVPRPTGCLWCERPGGSRTASSGEADRRRPRRAGGMPAWAGRARPSARDARQLGAPGTASGHGAELAITGALPPLSGDRRVSFSGGASAGGQRRSRNRPSGPRAPTSSPVHWPPCATTTDDCSSRGRRAADTALLERDRARLEDQVRRLTRRTVGKGSLEEARLDVDRLVAETGAAAFVELLEVEGDAARASSRRVVGSDATVGPVAEAEQAADGARFALRQAARGRPARARRGRRSGCRAAVLGSEVARWVADRPVVVSPTAGCTPLPWGLLPVAGRRTALRRTVRRSVAAGPASASAASDARGVHLRTRADDGRGRDRRGRLAPPGRRGAARRSGDRRRRLSAPSTARALAHVAAHGHFRAESPLFSSLDLADGPLAVHDFERLGGTAVPGRAVGLRLRRARAGRRRRAARTGLRPAGRRHRRGRGQRGGGQRRGDRRRDGRASTRLSTAATTWRVRCTGPGPPPPATPPAPPPPRLSWRWASEVGAW